MHCWDVSNLAQALQERTVPLCLPQLCLEPRRCSLCLQGLDCCMVQSPGNLPAPVTRYTGAKDWCTQIILG